MPNKNKDSKQGRVPLIAHVIYRLDVGGLENGIVNLINRMPAHRYRHAIICLSDYTEFRLRITQDVQLYALHKREGKDFCLYFRLWRLFRSLRPDVAHTRNLAALEAQLPAMLAGVRCRVHGEHGRDVYDLDGTRSRYRILRVLFRPLIDRYIPLSQELKCYLREDVGVAAQKITHICNGVDTKRFYPPASERDVLPFPEYAPPSCTVIGTVGRMEAVKDPLTLARAFVKLVSQTPDGKRRLRLVMIGDGSLRKQIENIFDEAQLSELVWLPGSRDDIPDLMRAMDIFVLPSLAEGISNTILEAMASGLPVVATDVGGNGELVVHGETGYLVPRKQPQAMAEVMRRYVVDDKLRRRHGQLARKHAVHSFGIDGMVRRYISVYDKLLHTKAGLTQACK